LWDGPSEGRAAGPRITCVSRVHYPKSPLSTGCLLGRVIVDKALRDRQLWPYDQGDRRGRPLRRGAASSSSGSGPRYTWISSWCCSINRPPQCGHCRRRTALACSRSLTTSRVATNGWAHGPCTVAAVRPQRLQTSSARNCHSFDEPASPITRSPDAARGEVVCLTTSPTLQRGPRLAKLARTAK
jgi:hypothetical protein